MAIIELPQDIINLAQCFPFDRPLYLVGGAVRDKFLNLRDSVDYDISGAMAIDDVIELIKPAGFYAKAVYPRTGTVVIGNGSVNAEYTQFRVDSYAGGNGKHAPLEVIFTDDIVADACRRDFTCNAIYYSIAEDIIIDPLLGVNDIANSTIITTREPHIVLGEDALRILRMVRFHAQTGLNIDTNTYNVAAELVHTLENISVERIREELLSILSVEKKYAANSRASVAAGVAMLNELGILSNCLSVNWSDKILSGLMDISASGVGNIYQRLVMLYIATPTSKLEEALAHYKYTTSMQRDIVGIHRGVVAIIGGDVDINNYNMMKHYAVEHYNNIDDVVGVLNAIEQPHGELFAAITAIREQCLPHSIATLMVNGVDMMAIGIQGKEIKEVLTHVLHHSVQDEINTREGQYNIALSYNNKHRRNEII